MTETNMVKKPLILIAVGDGPAFVDVVVGPTFAIVVVELSSVAL